MTSSNDNLSLQDISDCNVKFSVSSNDNLSLQDISDCNIPGEIFTGNDNESIIDFATCIIIQTFGKPGFGRKLYNGIKSSQGLYENSRWLSGTVVPMKVWASVHPLSKREIAALPEGITKNKACRIITEADLTVLDEDKTCDKITINDMEFDIVSKENWNNNIINHNEYLAVYEH